jgi:O-antigen/teichoic acid export membrane protein
MNNKAILYVTLTVTSFLVTSALSIWMVLFQKTGVVGILKAQLCGNAMLLIMSMLIVIKQGNISVNWRLVRPLISIGFPTAVGAFATLFLTFSDRWVIQYLLGVDQLGVYSVGVSFGMMISVLVGAFDTAWPPFFLSYLTRQEEAGPIFLRVFSYFIIGFGVISLAVFTFAKPAVQLLTAASFHDGWIIVGIVSLSQVTYGAVSILGTGIYFSQRLGYVSLIKWAAVALNIGLLIVLVPRLGIVGGAVSMLIGYLSMAGASYYVSRRTLKINYEWNRLGPFTLSLLCACAITWFSGYILADRAGSIVNGLTFLLFIGYSWHWVLHKSEREVLKNATPGFRYLLNTH